MIGYQILELVELCELPRLPSELIEMEEAGYSRKLRLAFDRACLAYVQRYRRMRDKTKQIPLPPDEKRRKHRPTQTVPFHTEEELLEFLGVSATGDAEAVSEILGELDAAMWDSVEFEEE